MPATPVLNYTFQNGEANNPDGSLVGQVHNARHEVVRMSLPGWGQITDALSFQSRESFVTIPPLSTLRLATSFTVEVAFRPTAFGDDRMDLVEGRNPAFSFYLERLDDSFLLRGAVNTSAGWQGTVSRTKVVSLQQWACAAMSFTGDEVLLFVNNTVVGRRVLRLGVPVSLDDGGSVVGAEVDGQRNQFLGDIAGLRLWDTLPPHIAEAAAAAEREGLGAIESKYLDLGGRASFLGRAIRQEVIVGRGRMRSYEGGDIYWSPETDTCEVHGAILAHYQQHGGADGFLGFPLTDEEDGGLPGSRVSLFEGGAIYWSPETYAHEMHGDIYVRYLYLNGERGLLGLPTSDEQDVPGGRKSECQGGTIYWSPTTNAHEVHGDIRLRYLELSGPAGQLGFPTSDESDVLTSDGQLSGGKFSRFQYGTVYWSPNTSAFEVHGGIRQLYETQLDGPRGILGYPLTNEMGLPDSDIRYNDFENGVIVWRPAYGAKVVTELELYLGWVRSGRISDGANVLPPSSDHSAELITYTTIEVNGLACEANVRRPRGHAGDSYNIDRRYPIRPVHSGTNIHLNIRVNDWDRSSEDDYLATLDRTFDIRSLWGMENGNGGVYLGHPSTHKGEDASRLDTVKFDFRISRPSTLAPGRPFREQAWWNFHNFTTHSLSREMYANTFTDVEVTVNPWEALVNPFDSLYYELFYKHSASGGTCFGMCLEALYALVGRSVFAEPIWAYTESDATRNVLSIKNGYQLGAAHVRWVIDRLTTLDAIRPLNVFDRVRRHLDQGDPCIVSMYPISDFSGHSVLAYAYQVGYDGAPHRILVADPNEPVMPSQPEADPLGVSYIEIFPNDTFRFVTRDTVPYQSSEIVFGLLPGIVMYESPFHILSSAPRTPFWEAVTVMLSLIGGILIVSGEGEAEHLVLDGRSFYKPGSDTHAIDPASIPGFARIPLHDYAAPRPELYAQRGRVSDRVELGVRRKPDLPGMSGPFQYGLRTPQNALVLTSSITNTHRDQLRVVDARTSRPILEIETTETPKIASVQYAVLLEERRRDRRVLDVNCGVAREATARVSATSNGRGFVVESAGPAQPMQLQLSTVENDQVRLSTVTLAPEEATGVLRVRPRDWVSPHGALVIERLSSFQGEVVDRFTVHPQAALPE